MNKAVSKYLAEIGRTGGQVSSPAKVRAARLNGQKGGRPAKKGKP